MSKKSGSIARYGKQARIWSYHEYLYHSQWLGAIWGQDRA